GHAVGDALLVGVAGALTERLRETDVVARLGGDEFAVIIPGETDEQAEFVARALVASITQASEPFGTARPVTASIGVVALHADLTAADALLYADLAMYRAKAAGKNGVSLYRPADADDSSRDHLRPAPGGRPDRGRVPAGGARAA
ncbi:MAG: GGDEF domain-containing protein, partial [Solirubrobacteraceae bacterium]|nr:GGDEF domain-containing protein [Solirubrobacteraceae bacterium]